MAKRSSQEGNMRYQWVCLSFLTWFALFPLCGQDTQAQTPPQSTSSTSNPHAVAKLPPNTILIKGAWWSASDSVTPLPETGSIADNVYSNPYFGIAWKLRADWYQQYEGPPPSDRGRYVLAEVIPSKAWKGAALGSVVITAEDLFFTPMPVSDARQLIDFQHAHLDSIFKVETPPVDINIAGRSFRFFSYWAPVTQLHWYVLATRIRCHVVEFVLSSRDPRLLEDLKSDMNTLSFSAEQSPPEATGANNPPVCLKDYAREENLIARVSPVFYVSRHNPIPVRIVIGKDGSVKHIHILSAFPEQSKAIYDALAQWKFKPYLRDGHPVEVETGIMFGQANPPGMQSASQGTQ
jgi:hypothetical protein